jgi:hypothetical protein
MSGHGEASSPDYSDASDSYLSQTSPSQGLQDRSARNELRQ